jgi:methionyl-tRNA synthetase
MLHALGFPDDQMPNFLVHGWWNISGTKMSKSLGNVVDPNELSDKYGAEVFRYYVMSDMAMGQDADFSEERLVQRYNTDLANNIGNLLSRSLNMITKFSGGVIAKSGSDRLSYLERECNEQRQAYIQWIDRLSLSSGLVAANYLASRYNEAIEREKPWQLAKAPASKEALAELLYSLAECLRIIAILLSPVAPKAAHGIFDQLNWKMELSGKEERFSLADAEWGKLPDGHVVGKPTPLFPRIETEAR